MEFVKAFLLISLIQFARYFVLAGLGWLAFWGWKNPWTSRRRIQDRPFTSADLGREFSYSILSSLIFGAILTVGFLPEVRAGRLMEFSDPATAWWSDAAWVAFLILVHDAYFYWMHRWIHAPALFRHVHRVHHLSRNPSPWASLSFHPIEAVLEIVWVLPLKFLLPIPLHVWVAFALILIAINVIGHLGVEIYPDSWRRHPVLKFVNRSTQHNRHHQYATGNYGLYFTFWDRAFGTLRKD